MFKKRKEAAAGEVPQGAPATALNNGAIKRRFLSKGAVEVERNRYFIVILALSGAIAAGAFATTTLFPLKQTVPYMVKVDNIGRAEPIPVTPERYKAGEAEVKYHIAQWVYQVMTVRQGLTRLNTTKAYEMVTGDAKGQFSAWMERYRPVQKAISNPDKTTDAYVTSINMLDKANLLVQFHTIETGQGQRERQDWTATIKYSTFTPTSEEEILKNPIGLRIENFSISKVIGGNQ